MSQDRYVAEELLSEAKAKHFINDKDHAALSKTVETRVKAAEWLVWPIDPEHPEWGGIAFNEFKAFWPHTYACSEHLADTIAHHGTEAHVKHVSWEPKAGLPCIMCREKANE